MTTPPPVDPIRFSGADAHELPAGGPEARVSAELRALPTIQMPADVTERIGASFHPPSGRQAPHMVSLGSPRRRRRRELIMATVASVVCVALAALIFVQWFGGDEPSTSSHANKSRASGTATGSAEQPQEDSAAAPPLDPQPEARPDEDNPSVSASGIDYQREAIRDQMRTASQLGQVSMSEAAARVPELAPLTQLDRLGACVTELSARGLLLGLDYAFFEGKPALVLLVSSPQDEMKRIVLVVGPACDTGVPDNLYSTSITSAR